MYGFWKTFFLKLLLSLVMVAGGFAFFIGALGTFNPGFQREVPGGIYFLLIGLGLMVGSWAIQRRIFPPVPKPDRKRKAAGRG
jgi:hypothetical protein